MVQAGDRDTDGLSIAANALELNGGAITAPNDTVRAKLSHGAVRPGAASKVDGNRSGAPHVRWMWFHGPASGDTYVRGERVVVTLAFDRATAVDTVGGRPRLALQVGDSTRYAYSNQAFRRPWQLVLEYVVQASDRDADGLSIAANALELNGAVITAPGDTTAAVLTHDSLPANAAHKVDGSRVRAARLLRMEISRRPSRDSTYTRGERLYVSASFDRDVAVDATGGRPRIALEIGDSTRYATYSYAYGGPSFHLFTYVVQAGDRDADGVSIAANALELNGGVITAVGDTVRAELSNDAVAAGGAYKVDGDRSSAPHVRAMWFVAPASGDTFLRGERVAVRMEFDRAHGGGHGWRAAAARAASRRFDAARVLEPGLRPAVANGVRLRGAGGGPGRRRPQHRGERAVGERQHDHHAGEHDGGGSDARLGADEPVAQGGRKPNGRRRRAGGESSAGSRVGHRAYDDGGGKSGGRRRPVGALPRPGRRRAPLLRRLGSTAVGAGGRGGSAP